MMERLSALVLDSDPASLSTISETLAKVNFTVFPFQTAEAALDFIKCGAAKEAELDLVLVEVNLNNMAPTNSDLLHHILNELYVPLVAMCSRDNEEALSKCMNLGARFHVLKPLDRRSFSILWHQALDHRFKKAASQGPTLNSTKNRVVPSSTEKPKEVLILRNDLSDPKSNGYEEPKKRNRFTWTTDLHEKFLDAVEGLGGDECATPDGILHLMNMKGLTAKHVGSHLQKHRLRLRNANQGGQHQENASRKPFHELIISAHDEASSESIIPRVKTDRQVYPSRMWSKVKKRSVDTAALETDIYTCTSGNYREDTKSVCVWDKYENDLETVFSEKKKRWQFMIRHKWPGKNNIVIADEGDLNEAPETAGGASIEISGSSMENINLLEGIVDIDLLEDFSQASQQMSRLQDADSEVQTTHLLLNAVADDQTPQQTTHLLLDAVADDQTPLQHMVPFNIKSDNIDNANDRPLKRSKCSEVISAEFGKNLIEKSSSPPSPSIQTDLGTVMGLNVEFSEQENCSANEIEHQRKNDQTYNELPQDYTMSDYDFCAQIAIETSFSTDILVKIDDIFVNRDQLMCLLDSEKYVNDDVISAYICCLKQQGHLQIRNGVRVFFENPIISELLKRDGNLIVHEDGNFVTRVVINYLNHDMILLPINIKNTHWYLAVVHAKKCEIQVLDSLCWEYNRDDLNTTLQGLQTHLNIIIKKGLSLKKWKNLDVTNWTVKEKLQEPLQKDGSSCGLFMLKFMEYWTGDALSQHITQENISHFRSKLAAVLFLWKTNTASTISNFQQSHDVEGNPNDIMILESPDEQKKSRALVSLSNLCSF